VFGFDEQPFRVDRLLVVDGLAEHGSYMSPLVAECLQDLTAGIGPGPHGRILVTRAPGAQRRLRGEAELARVAEADGIHAVDPGALPFAEQVALFKGARKVAGAMGAGLANIGFALPGTEVCVAAPGAMPDTFYWFLASLRGLRYTEIRCSSAAPGWDGEIVLDPEARAALLAPPTPPGAAGPGRAELDELARLLDAVFDPAHYLGQRGTAMAREDALLDYMQTGWRLGLNPSPRFDTDAYLLANDDVMQAQLNPLAHYVQ
jgi:hypothetical protein